MNSSLGINIAGHINGDFGLAQGVRSSIKAIEAAQIPFVLNNLHIPDASNSNTTYTNFSQENPYPFNLVQTNPNWLGEAINDGICPILKPEYFHGKYNIGFWLWELPKFPPQWEFAFDYFDEIWTMSNHCTESMTTVSPIPVLKIAPSIDLPSPSLGRESIGFPQDKFIFLFSFDFGSSFDRKNPLATIEAFKRAFGSANQDVLMYVKFYNSHHFPHQRDQLQAALANYSSIKLIDKYLSRDELDALIYNCDCYVSLHRAEGFGYTIAEAMYYGKPVIATGYSSNMDFMNVNNSFPVKYQLITTTEDLIWYPKGSIWAEVDVDHAAYLMKYVVENRQQAQEIGARASQYIKSNLNPHTVGTKIRERLELIMESLQIHDILDDKRWFGAKMQEHKRRTISTYKELQKLQSQM